MHVSTYIFTVHSLIIKKKMSGDLPCHMQTGNGHHIEEITAADSMINVPLYASENDLHD